MLPHVNLYGVQMFSATYLIYKKTEQSFKNGLVAFLQRIAICFQSLLVSLLVYLFLTRIIESVLSAFIINPCIS